MNEFNVVSGIITGMLRNYNRSYEDMCELWKQLHGVGYFPRTEDQIAQLFVVSSNDGKRWGYAPDLSAIYGGSELGAALPENFESSANIMLGQRLAMIAKQNFSDKNFVFCEAAVDLLILDGELLAIGSARYDNWLDMEDLVLKPKKYFEEKFENYVPGELLVRIA